MFCLESQKTVSSLFPKYGKYKSQKHKILFKIPQKSPPTPRAWSASKHCKNLRQAQRFRRHCSTLCKSKLMHLKNIYEPTGQMMLQKLIGVRPQRLLTCKTLSTSLTPYILYYYISLHGLHLILKACNVVLVNPAWSVAPVKSMHTIFTLQSKKTKQKKNHIYPKILFLCELLWLHL